VILPDVNVLLYAFRRDAERHADYRSWLDTVVNGEAAYGISPQVLASVIRIATHRRIYVHPSTAPEALAFCDAVPRQYCARRKIIDGGLAGRLCLARLRPVKN
jgi:uncharacterized protein